MPINKVLKDNKKRQKKITQHLTPHLVLNQTKSKFNLQTKKITYMWSLAINCRMTLSSLKQQDYWKSYLFWGSEVIQKQSLQLSTYWPDLQQILRNSQNQIDLLLNVERISVKILVIILVRTKLEKVIIQCLQCLKWLILIKHFKPSNTPCS